MQKPSLARMVLAVVDPHFNNGGDVAPAVVTRVGGEHPDGGWIVNLKVHLDATGDEWKTSVRLVDTEEDARALGGRHVAFWPPRV